MRRGREIADDQANVRACLGLKTLRYGFEDGVGIHVEQRGFGAESDDVRQRLIIGMAGEIGKAARSGDATEEGDVRVGGARQQHQHGGERREQYSLQDAEEEHGGKRDRCGIEIHPADAPHAKHRRNIDQSIHGGKNDGSEHSLRQVCQKPRQKQQAQGKRTGGKDESEGRSRACLVVDCGLRQAAGNGIAVPEPSREIGRANSKKFLPRVDAIAMLRGERARRRHAFDVSKQQTSGSKRNNPLDVAQAQPGRFERGQACRHLSFPKIPYARIRALRQNQSIILGDACMPSAA
jgi:hypothetical protein